MPCVVTVLPTVHRDGGHNAVLSPEDNQVRLFEGETDGRTSMSCITDESRESGRDDDYGHLGRQVESKFNGNPACHQTDDRWNKKKSHVWTQNQLPPPSAKTIKKDATLTTPASRPPNAHRPISTSP